MKRAALLSFLFLALAAGALAGTAALERMRDPGPGARARPRTCSAWATPDKNAPGAWLGSGPAAGKERAPEPTEPGPEEPAPLPSQVLLRARDSSAWAAPGRSVREDAEHAARAPAASPTVPWTIRVPKKVERASAFIPFRLVRFSARLRRSPPGR
ncbi:MAG: hypothetical protein HY720_26345 [Planctomycetes bacterium]|nr:hypothetical protein [Planctomycetota bacterium]